MKDRRIIHAVSFDYDGCLLPEELQTTVKQHNARFLQAIDKQNQHAYASCLYFLNSSRQSYRVNQVNRKPELKPQDGGNDESSCFRTLKNIVDSYEKSSLCYMLLADAYAERPDGYAYTRAILKDNDRDYHPGFVFDTYKSSTLYAQVHTAARLARSCDLITYPSLENRETLFKLPFESNAAYVFIESQQKFYYVNRAENETVELVVNDLSALCNLLLKLPNRVENEEQDFVMLDHLYHTYSGITLTVNELEAIKQITGHHHVIKDYPIIFDFFDDLEPILNDLYSTFESNKQRALLPKNVTIRFYQYDANKPDRIRRPMAAIQGSGAIDLKPKVTILNMAKEILKKMSLDEQDYETNDDAANSFAQFILNTESADFFKKREVVKPTVSHKYDDVSYDCHSLYSFSLPPEDVREVVELLDKLEDEEIRFSYLPSIIGSSLSFFRPEKTDLLEGVLKYSMNHDLNEVKAWIGHVTNTNHFERGSKTEALLTKIRNH